MKYKSGEYESWTLSLEIATGFSVGGSPFENSSKGAKGIVIKGKIQDGLDIQKAFSDLNEGDERDRRIRTR